MKKLFVCLVCFVVCLVGLFAKAPAPKVVAPLNKGDFIYESNVNCNGVVTCYFQKNGRKVKVWDRQIYVVKYEYLKGKERRIQRVSIVEMRFVDDSLMEIKNDRGGVFHLNIDDLSVKIIKGFSLIDFSQQFSCKVMGGSESVQDSNAATQVKTGEYKELYSIEVSGRGGSPLDPIFFEFSSDSKTLLFWCVVKKQADVYGHSVLDIGTKKVEEKSEALKLFPQTRQMVSFYETEGVTSTKTKLMFPSVYSANYPAEVVLTCDKLEVYYKETKKKNEYKIPSNLIAQPIDDSFLLSLLKTFSLNIAEDCLVVARGMYGDECNGKECNTDQKIDVLVRRNKEFQKKWEIKTPAGLSLKEMKFSSAPDVLMLRMSNIDRYRMLNKRNEIIFYDVKKNLVIKKINDVNLHLGLTNISPDQKYIAVLKNKGGKNVITILQKE